MDSAAQLAVMSKAKKVFGAEDTFLSFPVSPLPFTKRQLDFFSQKDAEDLRQSLHNLQAFSTLVNLIPADEAWVPIETHFLWDVYEQVLRADYASTTGTAEDEAAYRDAKAYLGAVGAGDVWEDSPAVKAYKQHKDAFWLAQQKYLGDKSTAESSTDPAVQEKWRDVDQPAQRAALDDLQLQWITVGHKNEVEAAQNKLVSIGAKSPILAWAEWDSRFNREIDTLTGTTDTSTVFPSLFSPYNALDQGAWRPFTLSEEEVKRLLAEAPAALRARFGADTSTSSAKSISLEFSSAAIVRPWFVADAFRARFWRFSNASTVISDGGSPAKGECPAYVTAVVFARNVTVQQKDAVRGHTETKSERVRFAIAPTNQNVLTQMRPVAGQTGAKRLATAAGPMEEAAQPGRMNPAAVQMVSPRMVQRATARDLGAAIGGAAPNKGQDVAARLLVSRQQVTVARLDYGPDTCAPGFVWREAFPGDHVCVTPEVRAQAAYDNSQADARREPGGGPYGPDTCRQGYVWRDAAPGDHVCVTPATRAQAAYDNTQAAARRASQKVEEVPQPTVSDDTIYILAFICKSVPKCPDPDPSLKW